ncbi:MAG: FKBP-type peptidyl-prolyl cis-trans isomerase [Paludibacter sp.]|jgi:FKBP-type peptidyl-prolyl cis-trans isomerase FklB|nr:FKBP-type peptidyl-prolyl cis-trans isomerase [Paludibacter sp.]
MEKISYALGLSLGSNLRNSGVDKIDYQKFTQGLKDVFENTEPEISIQEVQKILNDYFSDLQNKQSQNAINEGKTFLAANGKRPEVTTLASGLQYEVIRQGNGKKPSAADTVRVHYEGTLIDGTVFDSSIRRGEPAVFGVTQVIGGWVEALQLMTEGSKWKLFIPSDLAYGAQGAGQHIAPHSTLIFDVELIAIV